MNAVGLYVSAARLVLQHDSASNAANAATAHASEQHLLDLFRLLPHLRQSLSCAVCCRMLCDPYSLRDARCQHSVCRLCVRGRKNIRPTCSACKDCQDFKIYEENKQMRCLLLCYKSLCEHLLGSPLFQQICKQRTSPVALSSGIAVPTMSAQEFIMEGASYEDVLNAFTLDLPRPKLAPAAMPNPLTGTSAGPPLVPITLPVPKASTPPSLQQLPNTFPLPVVVKQEHSSAAPAGAAVAKTNPQSSSSSSTAANALAVKNFKNMVDLSSAVQFAPASAAAASPAPSSVTYVSHASAGVVVPIVSSSSVTTAPLTIASAKLQSLSRQLAQQQRNFVSVSSSNEIKPGALTLKLSSTSTAASSGVTTTTATVTSQVRNPPPIKTVSNGSAMYSVLYTGIGNKITIKRKTDGDDDSAQKKNLSNAAAAPPPVFRQVSKTNPKRRGCRCGNATPTPGKLTCCGQRCPCYVDSKSCIGCKCRGCRNPHRPDGGKVRPVIPELACYEIQMADFENSSLSPGELPIATSAPTSSNKLAQVTSSTATATSTSTTGQAVDQPLDEVLTTQPQVPTTRLAVAPTSSTTTSATIIPFRNMQQLNAVQQHATITALNAQQHQQQLQQLHQSSTQPQHQHQQPQTNLLQLENLQRESLLIQSAEGKYQVVNVFTTSQHNQNSSLQRIHTLPQLQAVTATSSSNVISNSNATFLLQPSNSLPTTATITSASSAVGAMQHHQMPEISTTLPQIIMQQAHSQQQQLQRTHLQQQLKTHNNVITVHPITAHSASQAKPPVSIAPSTITLSPIIVTSPNNTYSADMFNESSEEFSNAVNNVSHSTTTMSVSNASHVGSTFTIACNNSGGGGVVVAGAAAAGGGGQHHLAPAYVEVIESNEL